MSPEQVFSVSDAAAVINQTLEYAYPFITVVGEVANHKVSGGKWVFFDIKDDEMNLKCFAVAWQMRVPVEDGMQVQVVARPRLTKYGFSLNIEAVKPVGEGSIKKAFEMLRAKLDAEGLFAPERKRVLPDLPGHIGVISSTDAAGYKDFIKIVSARFSGMHIEVADTAVQGDAAADQIIRALKYFNESENPPEVIAILRGGGSRDDLVTFDDEKLVRAIAASRVPTIIGVGHEVDITLADLAADVRASTPSNAAEILVPDRREIAASVDTSLKQALRGYLGYLEAIESNIVDKYAIISQKCAYAIENTENRLKYLISSLRQVDPQTVLRRGYAVVRDKKGHILRLTPGVGDNIAVETVSARFTAKVTKIL
ncbi:exodeoxyribonuclease 7 large subunit [Alphaproteobacteria bacterium]|nr:exodeoxyribonuclease 7 large subunit [Alphaproteobacteria bacterium]